MGRSPFFKASEVPSTVSAGRAILHRQHDRGGRLPEGALSVWAVSRGQADLQESAHGRIHYAREQRGLRALYACAAGTSSSLECVERGRRRALAAALRPLDGRTHSTSTGVSLCRSTSTPAVRCAQNTGHSPTAWRTGQIDPRRPSRPATKARRTPESRRRRNATEARQKRALPKQGGAYLLARPVALPAYPSGAADETSETWLSLDANLP
jgi:hypothetical protein